MSKLRLVLQDITGTGATVFVPGHGPPGTAQEVATDISYIDMCIGAARDVVSQGYTSQARVARETAPGQFANWALSRFYTANLSSLRSKLAGPQASP